MLGLPSDETETWFILPQRKGKKAEIIKRIERLLYSKEKNFVYALSEIGRMTCALRSSTNTGRDC